MYELVAGSGSKLLIRIRRDPDPQHCYKDYIYLQWYSMILFKIEQISSNCAVCLVLYIKNYTEGSEPNTIPNNNHVTSS